MISLAGSPSTLLPMVSPKYQDSGIGLYFSRDGKARRTTANREQRNPQAGGAQTAERHVFGVEGDESIIEGVVGGHCRSTSFSGGREGDEGDSGCTQIFIGISRTVSGVGPGWKVNRSRSVQKRALGVICSW